MVLARGLLFVPCVRLALEQGLSHTIRVIIDGKTFETDETKAMAVGSLLAGIVVVAASPHDPVCLTAALPNLRSAAPPATESEWRQVPRACALHAGAVALKHGAAVFVPWNSPRCV